MFQTSKIEKSDFYLNKAFETSQKSAKSKKYNLKNKRERKKKSEKYKIFVFCKTLRKDIERIKDMFPDPEELNIFYQELFDTTIDKEKFGKALASFTWFTKKITNLEREYSKKIEDSIYLKDIERYKKEFYGRSSSIVKKISKHFTYLENARKTLRNFPTVRTNMFTICICGFPNVGKSTLLSKLTTATPKIQPYAFTTKSLMLGYMDKIQLIDTPGTFKDMLLKMNWIEKQSYLAIKYLADYLIYVFDISESCGFNVNDQLYLYNRLRNNFSDKEFLIYLSKNDILDKEKMEGFVRKNSLSNVFIDIVKLKKEIKKLSEKD